MGRNKSNDMYHTVQHQPQSQRIGSTDPYTKNSHEFKAREAKKRMERREKQTIDIFKSSDFKLQPERSVDKLHVKGILRDRGETKVTDAKGFKKNRFGSQHFVDVKRRDTEETTGYADHDSQVVIRSAAQDSSH